jgi:hypothetical protein
MIPESLRVFPMASDPYWLPLSEWWTVPGPGLLRVTAIPRASTTRSAVRSFLIDQTIESLSEAGPCEDEAFDSAVGRLLGEHPEPEDIWDLLDPTVVAIELEL